MPDPGAVTGGVTPARATWANDVRAFLLDHETRIDALETSLTLSFTHFWQGAIVDQDVAYNPFWNVNATPNGALYTGIAGSNVLTAGSTFPDAAAAWIFQEFALPTDWTGALDLRIFWKSTATTGNIVWQVQTAFASDGATIDPAFNSAQTVTDATQGSASRRNTASFTSLTLTGSAAGSTLYLKIKRDPTHGSDTLGADAIFLGAELTYRRAVVLP